MKLKFLNLAAETAIFVMAFISGGFLAYTIGVLFL